MLTITGDVMPNLALDFRLFRYALASAEHGSFRRAAAALDIQQSTVSRGVRGLEHRIGAELFERSHAGIRATPAGERFLEETALGFDHLERALQRIGAAQRGEHGVLTVAVSVPFRLLGDLFERFRGDCPGVSFEVVEGTCAASVSLVHRRKTDIAFVTNVPDGATNVLHLRDERMIAVLPKSHRLASVQVLTLEELRSERLIVSASGVGPEVADRLQRQMGSGSKADVKLLRIGQFDLIEMVARGFGITVAIGRLPHAGHDGVVLIPLAGKSTIPIHAVWLASTASPALKHLLSIVRRMVSKHRESRSGSTLTETKQEA